MPPLLEKYHFAEWFTHLKFSNKSPGGGGGASLFQTHLRGGGELKRDRGFTWDNGGLIDFAETEVSVLHKELECKVEKLKYAKLEVIQLRIKNKSY